MSTMIGNEHFFRRLPEARAGLGPEARVTKYHISPMMAAAIEPHPEQRVDLNLGTRVNSKCV